MAICVKLKDLLSKIITLHSVPVKFETRDKVIVSYICKKHGVQSFNVSNKIKY